ncbi:hypothetical protein LPJ57_002433 [Coemansia sp. RSA 486]|nr:hypothetical protein LPJ57_002433 [Coemansia sp. RSA 486]KAJ2233266.1 hypothetical protein IWW45_004317 [Coemansia sp. RSA 485]KAJ2598005.1 hypothetical protein GGF39_002818 [Coemansia sp. RSA 1721]KAJ2636282.1 hypothetical protein GGF40_003101 [Coemansia sp. RSA 1286]
MTSYPGGRNIFRDVDTDIPPPGTYDVVSPENPYKKYGFLNHGERFKAERQVDERSEYTGRSASHASQGAVFGRRATGSTAMTAIRAEETRLRREIEHYQKTLHELQAEGARDARMLSDKIKQAEQRIREMQKERTELRQRLLKAENELRAKEKEVDLLEKQQHQKQVVANPKTEKALRERSEAADAMCARLKAGMEKMTHTLEEHRRKVRQLEHQLRKKEQEKELLETELDNVKEADYPHQVKVVEKEMRHREEQWREEMRKLNMAVQDARDSASRYMNELGEATVHATALEAELHAVREKKRTESSELQKQFELAIAELTSTKSKFSNLEQRAKQQGDDANRVLNAANGHIDDLNDEIAHLKEEREQMRNHLHGEIEKLTRDYQNAQREFASTVKGADDERTHRMVEAQSRLERANKEISDLKSTISELRGILLSKEMYWKNRVIEVNSDLERVGIDYQTLQEQSKEQLDQLLARIEEMEQNAAQSESAWSKERSGLIEKLDGAHKDGFRLRDALDTLQKEASQTKADSEADVLRMKQELEDYQAEMDRREDQWAKERREMQRSHAESLSELKEEMAFASQQLNDEKAELDQQLQETHAELESVMHSREDDIRERDARLDDLEAELQNQMQINREIEAQLADRDNEYENRISQLEAAAEETTRALQDRLEQMQQELHEAQQNAEHASQRLQEEADAADDLRQENDNIVSQMQELEDINAELKNDCHQLQMQLSEVSDDIMGADEVRDQALSYYAGLMQALADKHRAEKDSWKAERKALRSRIDRYQYREAMYAIAQQHLYQTLSIKEDARLHMVQEARNLYCELQDQADIAVDNMDIGAELAHDLEQLLSLESSSQDTPEIEQMIDDMRVWTRRSFIGDMQRVQDTLTASAKAEFGAQELRFMSMHGEIVGVVEEMSQQHKHEKAKLKSVIDAGEAEYRQLEEMATKDRALFEARINELEAALRDSGSRAGTSADASELEAKNAEMTRIIAELEAQVDVVNCQASDDQAVSEQQLNAYEKHNAHLRQLVEECESNMATQVDQIQHMRQHIAEVESERAILAEQSQFQINWLKEHHAMAYKDLDMVLNNNGGHTNLRQRIKYVENLKSQILTLKKENFDCSRERDRFKYHVNLLKSELDAYKEVNDVELLRGKSRLMRGRSVSRQTKASK